MKKDSVRRRIAMIVGTARIALAAAMKTRKTAVMANLTDAKTTKTKGSIVRVRTATTTATGREIGKGRDAGIGTRRILRCMTKARGPVTMMAATTEAIETEKGMNNAPGRTQAK